MKHFISLIRPHQWAKNIFVFLPLFFSRNLTDISYLLPCLVVFLAFSLIASGIYCFNDILDVEADRRHPLKCKRPIASGALSIRSGYLIMNLCFIVGLGMIGCFHSVICELGEVIFSLVLYLILNFFYCLRLKHKPIIDVFIIATGFVFRVMVGGYATGIWLSEWMVLMTFLLALFLAFAKRRDDVVMYEKTGMVMRKNTVRYNVDFMNSTLCIIASITIVCYILYTVSSEVTQRMGSRYIYLTSIFVLAGIIRYLQLTLVDIKSGSPTKVLMKDRFIQMCIIGWLFMFAVLLYM